MADISDESLIRKAKAGDRKAFAVLVEKHYGLMFKVAWQWCGVKTDAEDIAQESAIKLARALNSFRFESAFSTWLYRLVINTAKDYYRAKNRQSLRETPLYEDAQYISQEQTPEQNAEHKDLLRLIAALPEDMRETLVLVCWQGLSHKEAGEVLGCAEGTISWRVHEARKKIADNFTAGSEGKSHG